MGATEGLALTENLTADAIRARSTQLGGSTWGLPIEVETRNRVQIAVGAYAYEIKSTPIFNDATFDRLAQLIQPRMGTCHPLIDEFFATEFSPMTGMWIHKHPELTKIAAVYQRYYSGAIREFYDTLQRFGKKLP